MKIFSSKAHGVADYSTAVVLFLAPTLFGFADLGGAAVWVPRLIGALVLGQSLMTDYELSLAKIIPLKVHLMMDYAASLFLAVSPFLFGFYNQAPNVWLPHVVVGLGYFAISIMTVNSPTQDGRVVI